MKILVIEDERDVRLNILEILSSSNFDTVHASNGREGIQLAKEEQPDLIICDIKMPDIDGYQVLSELRQDKETATIPFIFLTAKADKTDIRRGMNLGADDYLTKPFRRVELLETIAARYKKQQALLSLQSSVRELAEKASEKDELVCSITHDLRAPLTTIKVALQLLEMTPENHERYINVALTACDQGDELIQNLLHLYQLEAGETRILLEPIDLHSHLVQIINLFQVRTQNRHQTLSVEIPEALPLITSDGTHLQRVLSELLNNACKYTPDYGQIGLQFQECPDRNCVIFSIRNSVAIPPDELPKLFDKFYRLPNSTQQHGTGLGLPLVKRLVEQLSGQITVTSQEGWTTFTIELPYQLQSAATKSVA